MTLRVALQSTFQVALLVTLRVALQVNLRIVFSVALRVAAGEVVRSSEVRSIAEDHSLACRPVLIGQRAGSRR